MLLPLLLFGVTNIAAGCLQQAGAPNMLLLPGAEPMTTFGTPSVELPAPPAQLLSDEQVSTTPVLLLSPDDAAQPAVSIPVTRWVKNPKPTTLWSSSQADAKAFTDLPARSFLRLEGSAANGRLPVYYVGDGLLRLPGDAWVDFTTVEPVDPPAPGEVPAVDADASRPLPTWVQAHQATSLWSGPDQSAVKLTDLAQWTFLQSAGVGHGGRLLVSYAGDYGTRQPGIGWVDAAAVGPSSDPGHWVSNHRATALWSGVDETAIHFTDLPQWSKLRIVDGAPANDRRIQVQFFGDGKTRQPGIAWVAKADIGPITPPVPLPVSARPTPVPSVTGRVLQTHTFASDIDFINTVGEAARRSRQATGVPASVTIAQAILESDWGRSRLTRQANNLFGIKALSGGGPAGTINLATWEHLDASDVVVQAPFKAYFSLDESVDDHGRFFLRNWRYTDAMAVANDPRAFAQAIQDDGYATDPSYAAKLIRLMDRYDLYRFDS